MVGAGSSESDDGERAIGAGEFETIADRDTELVGERGLQEHLVGAIRGRATVGDLDDPVDDRRGRVEVRGGHVDSFVGCGRDVGVGDEHLGRCRVGRKRAGAKIITGHRFLRGSGLVDVGVLVHREIGGSVRAGIPGLAGVGPGDDGPDRHGEDRGRHEERDQQRAARASPHLTEREAGGEAPRSGR